MAIIFLYNKYHAVTVRRTCMRIRIRECLSFDKAAHPLLIVSALFCRRRLRTHCVNQWELMNLDKQTRSNCKTHNHTLYNIYTLHFLEHTHARTMSTNANNRHMPRIWCAALRCSCGSLSVYVISQLPRRVRTTEHYIISRFMLHYHTPHVRWSIYNNNLYRDSG